MIAKQNGPASLVDALCGRVSIVTGAASGIGAACARLLAGAGSRVALCDRDSDRLAALADELASGDGELITGTVDVSDEAGVSEFVDSVTERFGRVDSLLHFAGILESTAFFDITSASWNRAIDINLHGTFVVARAVALVMREQGYGRIVLTGSDSARSGSVVSGPAYAAAKGGIISLTRNMAVGLGPYGITVNAVNPGLTYTEMVTDRDSALVAEAIRRTPLGRLAEPDDIARPAVCLSSDLMGFVTGEVLEVNGGFYFD